MEKKKYIKASLRVVNLQADNTFLAGSLGYNDKYSEENQLGKKNIFNDVWDDEEDYEN